MNNFFIGMIVWGSYFISGEIKIFKQWPANWTQAQTVCKIYGQLLLPDLGETFKSLTDLPTEELFWINAKTLHVRYPSDVYEYVTYALYSAESKLMSYLCHNRKTDKVVPETSTKSITWYFAIHLCKRFQLELLEIYQVGQIRRTVTELQPDTAYWTGNATRDTLPNIAYNNSTEWCVGIIRLSDGSMLYAKDDCSNAHSFYCLKLVDEEFAPTLRRMSQPLHDVHLNFDSITQTSSSGENTSGMASNVLGSILGLAYVVVIGLCYVGVWCCKRKKRTQQRYLPSFYTCQPRRGNLSKQKIRRDKLSQRTTFSQNSYVDNKIYFQPYEEIQEGMIKRITDPNFYSPASQSPGGTEHSQDDESHSIGHSEEVQAHQVYEKFDPDFDYLQQIHSQFSKSENADLSHNPSSGDSCKNNRLLPSSTGPSTKASCFPTTTVSLPNLRGNVTTDELTNLNEYENEEMGQYGIVRRIIATQQRNSIRLEPTNDQPTLTIQHRKTPELCSKEPSNLQHRDLVSYQKRRRAIVLNSGMDILKDYENYYELLSEKEAESLGNLDGYENMDGTSKSK